MKENQNLKNKNSKNKSNFYHYTEKKELENNKSPTSIPFTKNKIIHLLHDNDGDLSNNKKERHRRSTSNDIEDINFYTQIKMKARNSCKNFDKFWKMNNYEDKISKNIEKNKQNLNNPKEYFSVLFNKILDRKKKWRRIFLDFNLNVFIYAFIALKYSLYIINNANNWFLNMCNIDIY